MTSHPLPILYSFRRCPYAMRARLALYTAQISHEHREVSLKKKPEEMLAISSKGTVPVLILTDGTVLEQSLDIMNWALGTPSLSAENQKLINENDTTFKYALDRYKYPGRYQEESDVNYQELCEHFLRKLEKQLQPFLEGNTAGFTDMALFPFIRQFSMVNPQWFAVYYPHLETWLDFFISSDLFQEIMKVYEPWVPEGKVFFIEPKSHFLA